MLPKAGCQSVEALSPKHSAGSGDPAYTQEAKASSLVGRVPSRGVDSGTDGHRASGWMPRRWAKDSAGSGDPAYT